ncbi:class D sortase [uncultured Ruthenibacterium sp.]|uniref:class D sortase n=1 Tax=uncultured Ruthenibacterium sp. TaxID=1905347 RepID=UPI00349E5468
MDSMKKLLREWKTFFCNRENWILPVVFCLCTLGVLAFGGAPVMQSVAQAANVQGYKAVPSPKALFETQELEPAETVDLAQAGGMPQQGELYGTLNIEGTAVECNLYYGDSEAELHAGAGTYTDGSIPGQSGATLIGGHTGTFFRDLESVQLGSEVVIETRYGEYHYEVTEMEVVRADEFGMDDLQAAPDRSVLLYTCYPFGQLTLTPYRYMVCAEYVSGPKIVEGET